MSDDTFSVEDVVIERETHLAVLVRIDGDDDPVWVPKSVIHDNSEIWKAGQEPGTLVVHAWWAHRQGWC